MFASILWYLAIFARKFYYMSESKNPVQIQGVSLESIANQFGTPVYVYDGEKIVNQVKNFREAFSGVNMKIKYATKALSNISILKLMRRAGAGVDAVSIQEVYLCMKAGYPANEIMYTPNCVEFDEVVEAVALGVNINLDNLPILEQFGKKYGNSVPVCIRINPHIMAGGNAKISVGHIASKFGISIHQLEEIKEVVIANDIRVNGLHLHTGSDILEPEVFLKAGNVLFDAAANFPDLEFLDFGGGFKVGYKDGDVTTDISHVGKVISEAFQAFCQKYGKELELWFEPGKFMVSECGYLVVKSTVVKKTPQITFIGVNSGLNHLLRPMMYDAYHGVYNVSNPDGPQETYSVVGYICETDTLASDRKIAEVSAGDLLVLKNAGAYGFSMASNYNSRYLPAEVLVWEGKANLIRKREEMEDLIRNQVILDI